MSLSTSKRYFIIKTSNISPAALMSENQKEPQYKLRWSEELRDKVVESAKSHNRSINAEIVHRLEESFEPELKVSDTLEFDLMYRSYMEQAKEVKKLRELLEEFMKKPS